MLAQPNSNIAKTRRVSYDWRPGFVSITEATGAPGLGLTDDGLSKYYYGITTVVARQFTRNIKIGAGAGVHIHDEGLLWPLYLDMRYSFNAQQLVPFLSGDGGIMLDFSELENTRVFINPSAGIRYLVGGQSAVSFSTGLMVTTGGANSRKSYVNFRLGYEFKPGNR